MLGCGGGTGSENDAGRGSRIRQPLLRDGIEFRHNGYYSDEELAEAMGLVGGVFRSRRSSAPSSVHPELADAIHVPPRERAHGQRHSIPKVRPRDGAGRVFLQVFREGVRRGRSISGALTYRHTSVSRRARSRDGPLDELHALRRNPRRGPERPLQYLQYPFLLPPLFRNEKPYCPAGSELRTNKL